MAEVPNLPHNSFVEQMYKINISFTAVVCLVILLRLFVRLHIVRHVAIEDHLMVGAGLFFLAFSTMNLVGTKYGLGRHLWDLPAATAVESVKKVIQTLWICQVMYSTALTLAKLSIISSYHRLFPTTSLRRTMYTLGLFIILVWICNIFTTIFQCSPVKGAWDYSIPAKCISVMKFYYFTTAFNILTDLLLCTLPLPLFWKLKLPFRERFIVSVLFMLGLFATAASVLRMAQLHGLDNRDDVTAAAVSTLNWSVVEVGTGIVCACVPCLKPLFRGLLSDKQSSSRTPKLSGASSKPGTPVVLEADCELTKPGSNSWTSHEDAPREVLVVTTRQFV